MEPQQVGGSAPSACVSFIGVSSSPHLCVITWCEAGVLLQRLRCILQSALLHSQQMIMRPGLVSHRFFNISRAFIRELTCWNHPRKDAGNHAGLQVSLLVQNMSIKFSFCFLLLRPGILGKAYKLAPSGRLSEYQSQACSQGTNIQAGWDNTVISFVYQWRGEARDIHTSCSDLQGRSRSLLVSRLLVCHLAVFTPAAIAWEQHIDGGATHRWRSFNYCWDAGGRQGLSEHDFVCGGGDLSFSLASIMASADNCTLASSARLESLWWKSRGIVWISIFAVSVSHTHTLGHRSGEKTEVEKVSKKKWDVL